MVLLVLVVLAPVLAAKRTHFYLSEVVRSAYFPNQNNFWPSYETMKNDSEARKARAGSAKSLLAHHGRSASQLWSILLGDNCMSPLSILQLIEVMYGVERVHEQQQDSRSGKDACVGVLFQGPRLIFPTERDQPNGPVTFPLIRVGSTSRIYRVKVRHIYAHPPAQMASVWVCMCPDSSANARKRHCSTR